MALLNAVITYKENTLVTEFPKDYRFKCAEAFQSAVLLFQEQRQGAGYRTHLGWLTIYGDADGQQQCPWNYSFSSDYAGLKFTVNGNKLTVTTATAPNNTVTITAAKNNSQRKGLIVWSDGNYAPGVGDQETVSYDWIIFRLSKCLRNRVQVN